MAEQQRGLTETAHTPSEEMSPPHPQPTSSLYNLVKTKLGHRLGPPLDQYILQERSKEPPVPFYAIARTLFAKTQVNVTHEAVRRWYNILASNGSPEDE